MSISLVIFAPVVGGLVAAALPSGKRKGLPGAAVALLFALLTLGFAIYMTVAFDPSGGMQWATTIEWIRGLGVHYAVGVDGLNVWLILLTTVLWVAAIVATFIKEVKQPRLLMLMLMLGETAVLGALTSQDLILFVAFFDLMLVPFYFLIGIWGGKERQAATTRFVIYTLIGSLLMLVAAVATGVINEAQNGHLTFLISDLKKTPLADGTQKWLFLFFAIAFLVKMPGFPLHGWMPAAYGEAPIPVAALLTGVLSKVAAYGFLRIVLPLYPAASSYFQELMLVIAVITIIYASVIAFSQTNIRMIVAYSSMAQLGFILAGIFALRPEGASAAILQMVNHGLVGATLFFIVGILATRYGTEDLRKMGGTAFRAPILAGLFMVIAMANLAIPGTANFIGEFLILLSVFQSHVVLAILASSGVIFAAVYMLRFYQRTMHNRTTDESASREIGFKEAALVVPLVVVILALAIYPRPIMRDSDKSVTSVFLSNKPVSLSMDDSVFLSRDAKDLAGTKLSLAPRYASMQTNPSTSTDARPTKKTKPATNQILRIPAQEDTWTVALEEDSKVGG